MNFASDFAYVPTVDDDEGAAMEEVDDSDLEDGVLAENIDVLSAMAPPVTNAAAGEEAKQDSTTAEPRSIGARLFGAIRSAVGGSSARTSARSGAHCEAAAAPPRRPRRRPGAAKRRYRRRIDTNVVSICLDNLADDVAFATGDANECAKCHAVLSVLSTIVDHEGTVIAKLEQPPPPPPPTAAATAAAAATPTTPERGDDETKQQQRVEASSAPEVRQLSTMPEPRVAADPTSAESTMPEARQHSTVAEPKSIGDAVAAPAPAPAPVAAPAAGGAGGGAGAGTGVGGVPAVVPEIDEGDQLWACEFCGHHNVVTLDDEEIPKSANLDYVLEAAPASATASDSSSIIVFVLDCSGSMCVSQPMRGDVKLRGDHTAQIRDELGALALDEGNQHMPGERGVTYVSRMQAVQAAVSSQIEALKADHPNRRVALVTFSSDVTIFGDGTSEPRTLAGTRLENYEELVAAGSSVELTAPVKDTAGALVDKVYAVSEGGSTALGPAVLTAVAMASASAGSRVVVCTDGLANVGLGALDELKTDDERDAATAFYNRVGLLAMDKGVAVDVIGIEGEGCDVETLTAMVETSGGEIDKVNPMELHKNFGTAMANPVLATKVSATIMLHAGLHFRNDADGVVSANRMVRDLGNATKDTELTFEYSNKTRAQLSAAGIDLSTLTHFPFQVQIRYTKLSGMKCMRVISQAKRITHDIARAEAGVDTSVISSHVQQTCAAMASAGDYEGSRATALMYGRMMKRTARTDEQRRDYGSWAQNATELELALRNQEDTEELAGGAMADTKTRSKMRKAARSGNDYLSSIIHKQKRAGRRR